MQELTSPNLGANIILLHAAISRSMGVTKTKCQEFMQPARKPDQTTQDSFILYVSTMCMVINAHHIGEDDIIFPKLRSALPQAPFDELSIEHDLMDVVLAELRQIIETSTGDFFISLLDAINRMIALWTPHIAKEERYIYSSEITAALMRPEEHLKMLQETSAHAMEQGNPALMLPFVLRNLNPEDRKAFARILPPEMVQTLIPTVWKPQWSPMLPFFLE